MRKLCLGLGFGKEMPIEEQIERCAKIGWDGVFTGWSEDNPDWNKLVRKACDDNGMFLQSVHLPYIHVDRLWEEGEKGIIEQDTQIRAIREFADLGVDLFILHTIIGMEKNNPTELGLERYAKIFDEAEKLGVSVALENTEGEVYLDYLFKHFDNHKAVKFCVDTGHEQCYNYGHDLITKWGSKLVGTHLNDNMGMTGEKLTWHDDSHLMPFDGIVDWEATAKRLNNVGYKGPLTFELTCNNKPNRNTHDIYNHLDYDGFASLALEKAKKFRDLVENN